MAQYRTDTNRYLNDNKTLFEVVMLSDQFGNPVAGGNAGGTAVDAFGRLRSSTPFTLFDSFNRYQDNGKYSTAIVTGGSTSFDANKSTVNCIVDGTSGAKVTRETNRVFAYQPGKSLQIFNTFVMSAQSTGLRQRVGYYNDNNGIFVELADDGLHFVKRTNISGTPADVRIDQTNWSVDAVDGNGPSGINIDITKAQIFWMDIEWLGVGSVRCGFVVDGKFIHCHTFNHANTIDSVYMTTAILPIRYEIENTTAGSSATLQQICSSVISEGGYELKGRGHYIGGSLLATAKTISTTVFSPLISVRLKSTRLDAVSILSGAGLVASADTYDIRLIKGGTLTGASWQSAGTDSAIEYDTTATAVSGGDVVRGGLFDLSNQSSATIKFDGDLFDLQFERNGLTGDASIYTIVALSDQNAGTGRGFFNWQEIT